MILTKSKPVLRAMLCVAVALSSRGIDAFADPATVDIHPSDETRHVEYKLTLSNYSTQNLHANDLNIRANLDNQTGWLGYYKEGPSGFEQVRGGYERTDHLWLADVVTSLQAANHGFLGGSITATAGETFFGILGYGRTNLKPYANLNFDPNDAITLGVGWKMQDGPTVSFFAVRDDRVVPGQQNTHFLIRAPLPNQQRLTLDIIHKSGPADPGQSINGTGVSVTYDWPTLFLRLAYDPKVNFTQEDMTRLSFGMRF
jgi:hypothetical protein